MSDVLQRFTTNQSSDWNDEVYGPGHRCAVTLNDGTELPCVLIRKKKHLTDLAINRFNDERSGKSVFAGSKDGYRAIVESFVAQGNRLSDFDVSSVSESRFAIPKELLDQIRGESFMSWTGWVFEMKDGRKFSYGTRFNFAFFQLPTAYSFSDVAHVHNHSRVDAAGSICDIRTGDLDTSYFQSPDLFRERIFFDCYID